MLSETQRRKVEQDKLDSMQEMMENIAHQWRQPLSQINSNVSSIDKILYDKNIVDSRLEEKLQEIENITKQMSNTIDDFKNNFVNNNVKTEVDLKEVIQETIEALLSNFQEHHIKILTDFKESYPISCYANELKQVLMVLLNNAKDAHLTRNTYQALVKISIYHAENSFVIKLCDNAGGIPKSVRNKIFEPYYTTKHKSQGTGLGLFMARKIIIERLGGQLSVENVGDGSCFSISLIRRINYEQ